MTEHEFPLPKVDDFYRFRSFGTDHAENARHASNLHRLTLSMLPVEHGAEIEQRDQLTEVYGYLMRRTAVSPVIGRALSFGYALEQSVDRTSTLQFTIAGKEGYSPGSAALYKIRVEATNIHGQRLLPEPNHQPAQWLDLSNHPFAVGRVLVTAFDLVQFTDAEAAKQLNAAALEQF